MKYAIIECVNGNYFVRAEGITSLDGARAQYHERCKTLWNAQDVITATIAIVDEGLNYVEAYREYIHHEAE